MPRLKCVGYAHEEGAQLRIVSHQHRLHAVGLDPTQAKRSVDFGGIVDGEKAVTLDPASSRQDEDPERGVTEAEPPWRRLGEHAHHRVDLIDVAIDLAQFPRPYR